MNNIDNHTRHNRERIPVVYIAGIQNDKDGAIKAWLKHAVASFTPLAIADPGTIIIDNADYDRLTPEALNEFLVDADADAVVWATAPDGNAEYCFHCAVSHYPKVKYQGRQAKVFTVATVKTGDAATGRLLAANVLSAALSEIADIRLAPSALIRGCIDAMETALAGQLERGLYLNTLEELQTLYFIAREDQGWERKLRRAIDLNERLCRELEGTDTVRIARLMHIRASKLAILGERTGNVQDIMAAITALKKAAPDTTDDVERARLDVTLANCKSALGLILGDTEILKAARDVLRNIIPVLYRHLAVESWAVAQTNLSATCWNLYGATDDFAYGDEALDAVQEALTIYNPKNFPLDWAMAKQNLGCMLGTLGQDPKNLNALQYGIDCLRDALTVYTRDTVPMDYAMASANLAASLCTLADYTKDTDHLKSAETCLLQALDVYTAASCSAVTDIEERLDALRRKISAAA